MKCQGCDTADTYRQMIRPRGKRRHKRTLTCRFPLHVDAQIHFEYDTTSRRLVQTLYLFHEFNRSEGAKRSHYGVLEQGQINRNFSIRRFRVLSFAAFFLPTARSEVAILCPIYLVYHRNHRDLGTSYFGHTLLHNNCMHTTRSVAFSQIFSLLCQFFVAQVCGDADQFCAKLTIPNSLSVCAEIDYMQWFCKMTPHRPSRPNGTK